MKIEKNILKLKRLVCEMLVHEVENARIVPSRAYSEIIKSSRKFVKTSAFRELAKFAIGEKI